MEKKWMINLSYYPNSTASSTTFTINVTDDGTWEEINCKEVDKSINREKDIIDRLYEIKNKAKELRKIAETGTDGNLEEMSYHIQCYSEKIITHLLKTWNLNERVAKRRNLKNN